MIYDEYVSTKTSFSLLAKKYGLTSQRISFIINDLKSKGLEKKLELTDTKETREGYKDLAVEMREKGSLELSLKMFDELIEWDTKHKNFKGLMDVFGHKKIALGLLSDKTDNKALQTKYLTEAIECIEKALAVSKENPNIPAGSTAVQHVHKASLLAKISENSTGKEKHRKLTEALKLIDSALPGFPGSPAHLAWPLGIKAVLLHLLGKDVEAISVLGEAEKALFVGYEQELKNEVQGKLHLRVWNTGILLRYAIIYADAKKPILAEAYASAVINTPDPEKILVVRKREARRLLKSIR